MLHCRFTARGRLPVPARCRSSFAGFRAVDNDPGEQGQLPLAPPRRSFRPFERGALIVAAEEPRAALAFAGRPYPLRMETGIKVIASKLDNHSALVVPRRVATMLKAGTTQVVEQTLTQVNGRPSVST